MEVNRDRAKRRPLDYGLQDTLQDADTTPLRKRRATSSESVSIYRASSSPCTDGSDGISSPRREMTADPASRMLQDQSQVSASDTADNSGNNVTSASYSNDMNHSSQPNATTLAAGILREGAPVANMAPGPTRGASHGSDESLFVPMNEDSANRDASEGDLAHKDTVSAENWGRFKGIYKELLTQDRVTSKLLHQMNNEHHNALERARKVAGRRNHRIEQLNRENAALRGQISNNTTGASSSTHWEGKFNMSQQALQMLTEDCVSWEAKYKKLQRELEGTIIKASSAEREAKTARENAENLAQQLESCNKELREARRGLKSGSGQLKSLQNILTRTDDVVIDRVRALSNLSSLWDESGNERLRTKVADQVTAMVDAWKRFEAEYDDAVGHTD